MCVEDRTSFIHWQQRENELVGSSITVTLSENKIHPINVYALLFRANRATNENINELVDGIVPVDTLENRKQKRPHDQGILNLNSVAMAIKTLIVNYAVKYSSLFFFLFTKIFSYIQYETYCWNIISKSSHAKICVLGLLSCTQPWELFWCMNSWQKACSPVT